MKRFLSLLLVSTLSLCTVSAQTKTTELQPVKEVIIIKNAAAGMKPGDVFVNHPIPDAIKQSKAYRVEWIAANVETGGIQHVCGMGCYWCEPVTTCYLASYIYWNGQVLILTMNVATGCTNTVANYNGLCDESFSAPTQEQVEAEMIDYITINAPDHDLHIKQNITKK